MSGNATRDALLYAVRERLAAVADAAHRERDPESHLTRLKETWERLEALRLALPREADPMLQHYLQRGSLEKAAAWLEIHENVT